MNTRSSFLNSIHGLVVSAVLVAALPVVASAATLFVDGSGNLSRVENLLVPNGFSAAPPRTFNIDFVLGTADEIYGPTPKAFPLSGPPPAPYPTVVDAVFALEEAIRAHGGVNTFGPDDGNPGTNLSTFLTPYDESGPNTIANGYSGPNLNLGLAFPSNQPSIYSVWTPVPLPASVWMLISAALLLIRRGSRTDGLNA